MSRILLITINLLSRMKTDQAAVTKLLQQWDHGSKSVRSKILQDFITSNHGKTGPELELEFAHAASLFLTRITAWLRLTYPFHVCSGSLDLLEKASEVFLHFPGRESTSKLVTLIKLKCIPRENLINFGTYTVMT